MQQLGAYVYKTLPKPFLEKMQSNNKVIFIMEDAKADSKLVACVIRHRDSKWTFKQK